MTKHKLEQHEIMPTTLPTELINNFLEVCIGLYVLPIQNTEPLFTWSTVTTVEIKMNIYSPIGVKDTYP